jgi:RNA polymerase sigma factor (sigma-70 family)
MTLTRKHLTRDPLTLTEPGSASGGELGADELQDEATGVVTRAARRELHDKVTACLRELDDKDREVIVLRGVEQLDGKAVAVMLGISPEAVATRFCRALARLRARLPGEIFDELGEATR